MIYNSLGCFCFMWLARVELIGVTAERHVFYRLRHLNVWSSAGGCFPGCRKYSLAWGSKLLGAGLESMQPCPTIGSLSASCLWMRWSYQLLDPATMTPHHEGLYSSLIISPNKLVHKSFLSWCFLWQCKNN